MSHLPGDNWTPPSARARPCNARTRAGAPCRGPAVHGKTRCRMHGGAAGSGAQPRNRLTHGLYTRAAVAERRWVAALIRESERLLAEMEGEG